MMGNDRCGVIVTISRLEMALFVKEMQDKMDKRQSQYGDSWRSMSVDEHIEGLETEIMEWQQDKSKPKELVDIANRAMMLYDAILKER